MATPCWRSQPPKKNGKRTAFDKTKEDRFGSEREILRPGIWFSAVLPKADVTRTAPNTRKFTASIIALHSYFEPLACPTDSLAFGANLASQAEARR
jgi:hypothetical protein